MKPLKSIVGEPNRTRSDSLLNMLPIPSWIRFKSGNELQSYVVITCKWSCILWALCLICFWSHLKHTWPPSSERSPFCFGWCTCRVPGWPVSLLPTVIVYSLWPYDRILSSGSYSWPAEQCITCTGVDYIPRLSRSLIVEGNRAVNTHQPTCPLAARDLSCHSLPIITASDLRPRFITQCWDSFSI